MFFFALNRTKCALPPKDYASLEQILHPVSPPDQRYREAKPRFFLYESANGKLSESIQDQAPGLVPYHHKPTGIRVLSWARIDNRDELGQALDLRASEYHLLHENELFVLAFLKWGKRCGEHIVGEFSFILFDEQKNEVVCIRDPVGSRPLFYFCSNELFLCATSVSGILWWLGNAIEIKRDWIAKFSFRMASSFDETPFRKVFKLPPAHYLHLKGTTSATLDKYFDLQNLPCLRLPETRDFVDLYRETLEKAVQSRLVSDFPIGVESSGGIDSSTVLAFAAKTGEEINSRLHTFTTAFSELEPEFSMATSQAYRVPVNHVITGTQSRSIDVIKRGIQLQGFPVEMNIADMSDAYFRIAQQFNIKTMLSGFGGDEFATCTRSDIVLMELFLNRQYSKTFRILPGNLLFKLLRFLKLWIKQQQTADFRKFKFDKGMQGYFDLMWSNTCLKDDVLESYQLKQQLMAFIGRNAPVPNLRQYMVEKSWSPYIPTRLENCSLMASGYNIEYRWPLLDIRLIQLVLSIPSDENYFRGYNRYLHRRAIDGVVPEKITWKANKNMGPQVSGIGPFVQWDFQDHLQHLHPVLKDMIDHKKLVKSLDQIEALERSNDQNAAWNKFYIQRSLTPILYLNEWLLHTA
ncbi:MAG: asparagine synthase-related protein [Pseudomonadales bacterium]|nr:asparagine synthase-related protein [Pseudomonadales bacterium]